MEEKTMKENTEEFEIDLTRLLGALVKKAWMLVIVSVLCALMVFGYTFFFVAPLYQSSAMFYVNNSSISLGEGSVSISSGDISASRGLVQSYIVIMNTRETLNDVISYAGVNRTYDQIKDMISAAGSRFPAPLRLQQSESFPAKCSFFEFYFCCFRFPAQGRARLCRAR